MLIQDFLDVVASYLGKSTDYFNEGSNVDKLLLAANHAKKFCQRRALFELAKRSVSVPVLFTRNQEGHISEATGLLSEAVDVYTREPIIVRKIRYVWMTRPDGYRFPLELWSDKAIFDRLRRRLDLHHLSTWQHNIGQTRDPKVFQVGNVLHLFPAAIWEDGSNRIPTSLPTQTSLELRVDVYEWMKDYGPEGQQNTVETDFILDHCSDFLLYRMITELNFFLKEDQRMQISQGKLNEAWDSVLAWNDTLIDGDENLD